MKLHTNRFRLMAILAALSAALLVYFLFLSENAVNRREAAKLFEKLEIDRVFLTAMAIRFQDRHAIQVDAERIGDTYKGNARHLGQTRLERIARSRAEPENELQAMGVKAVPFLIDRLRQKDSKWKRKWNAFLEDQSWLRAQTKDRWNRED